MGACRLGPVPNRFATTVAVFVKRLNCRRRLNGSWRSCTLNSLTAVRWRFWFLRLYPQTPGGTYSGQKTAQEATSLGGRASHLAQRRRARPIAIRQITGSNYSADEGRRLLRLRTVRAMGN